MKPLFEEFPKMARLSREIIITEKIDGTNAQVFIDDAGNIKAGSRTRWIKVGDDNFGFAAWVEDNKNDLLKLGPGRHFGEWWGRGIQRGYSMPHKVFSLFNVHRWSGTNVRPACCGIVPVLYRGDFNTERIDDCLKELAQHGSFAVHGFMNPEGIVVWHTAANMGFKKTILKDEVPKSLVKINQ